MASSTELIYSGKESLVYIERDGGKTRVRKVLRDLTPDLEQVQRFYNEYEFTKSLDIEGVRKALGKDRSQQQHSILLDFVDGVTLEEAFVVARRPLADVLDAFIAIAHTLGRLHDNGIIHKDINGKNILWSHAEKRPIIIDFGISSRLDYAAANLGNPDTLRATLTHVPPEQTGRVNRRVDSRSDLYSLGVTMYECLAGTLPFYSDDSLQLVHYHIARQVVPVHHLNHDVPEILSQIVSKLMAKDAEDRYQSAYGLEQDLRKCRESLSNGSIAPFTLSQHDISGKFRVPQKLYGREREVASLMKSFDRISHGGTELFLVSGYSGVGKSSLVAELYKPITEHRGYFVGGKFDQYQRNVPFSAIVDALTEFCDLLLTEREQSLRHWASIIQEAVGTNGAVIADLVPALERVIGVQPPVPKLETQEAQNRLAITCQNLIRAIAQPEHPFVLFCDDLQWADRASLTLLKQLVTSNSNPYLLVIGAYRSNEIHAGHPLTVMLEEARTGAAVIEQIDLQPLKQSDLQQLIHDALHLDQASTVDLATIVYEKTLGNAFFSLELLKSLNQDGSITYDHDAMAWKVDFTSIRSRGISANVVDLLVSKISSQPAATQHALMMASCAGGLFDVTELATVMDLSSREVLAHLWPALEDGLVTPVNENYQYLTLEEGTDAVKVPMEFSHDRVQQAAYSLLEPEQLASIHLKMGRYLQSVDHENIFDIVEHLNEAEPLITEPADRFELARLNLSAAEMARDTGSYPTAREYVSMAYTMAPDNTWDSDHEFAMKRAVTEAELEYLNGQFERSDEIIRSCLEKAESDFERSRIYFLLMQNQSNREKYLDAIILCRQGLAELGFTLPEIDEAEALIPAELGKILTYFTESGVDSIIGRPDMTDEKTQAIINILDNLSPPAYLSGSTTNLWVLHVLYKVNLTIEHGLSPQGGYAFAELGLFFFIIGNYQFAYPCAQMAMRITEKFRDVSPRHLSRAGHIVTNYNTPWVKHVSDTIPLNNESYHISLDCGELIFAGYTSLYPNLTAFYLGKESIASLLERLPESLKFTRAIRHDLASYSLTALQMVLYNLGGRTESIATYALPDLTEAEFQEQLLKVNTPYAVMAYQVYKAYSLILHGDWEGAHELVKATEPLMPVMTGAVVLQTLFIYIRALVTVSMTRLGKLEAEAVLPSVEADLGLLQLWAEHNPANFEHKKLFIEAELAVLRNEVAQAVELYEDAIESAVKYEYLRESGLIHLHAARYWLDRGVKLYAQAHADSASSRFSSLGYDAVVDRIGREFADVLHVADSSVGMRRRSTTIATTTDFSLRSLDASSLMKAARAISGSLELDALVEQMLHIVLENAGAQRAVLMTNESGAWMVDSEVDINSSRDVVRHGHRLESSVTVPVSLVNYVVRTGSAASSSNEATRKLVERDPYTLSYSPVSYFCLPLTHQNHTNAILYAETRRGTDFVTPDRIEVIQLLSSQMAIALENARLYKRQSDLMEAAQRFVPQDFIRALGKQDLRQARLGDAINQEMTVMSGDIRSYSSIAESLTVEETFQFINRYLQTIGPVIREHGGFINHYHGDGFIALFKRGAADALNAALDILKELDEFNKKQIARHSVPIKIGIGIHSGQVMMGIIGDGERLDANVISDAVNTASRLESMTKVYGSTILLSEHTLQRLSDVSPYDIRFLGRVSLVGKEEIVSLYELFNLDPTQLHDDKQRTFKAYNEAINAFYSRDFNKAVNLLESIVAQSPNDSSAMRFLARARECLQEPPGDDWHGVENMLVK